VLSGDILVEQNIHSIDICNWVLRSHPVKAIGTGGRRGRVDDGSAWTNFSLLFFYPNQVSVAFSSTQFAGKISGEVNERFFGTRGKCQTPYTGPVRIEGEEPWLWPGKETSNIASAEAEKQKAFIDSITGGHFHKNWGHDDFRKVVLNAILWIAKADVPASGVESRVTPEQLAANQDDKGRR
jgi:predicted dehydrogenase